MGLLQKTLESVRQAKCLPHQAQASHQLSTADDDAQHPAVLSHLRALNVLSSTPPRPEMRKPICVQRLDALMTKPGEKSVLGPAAIVEQAPSLLLEHSIFDLAGEFK